MAIRKIATLIVMPSVCPVSSIDLEDSSPGCQVATVCPHKLAPRDAATVMQVQPNGDPTERAEQAIFDIHTPRLQDTDTIDETYELTVLDAVAIGHFLSVDNASYLAPIEPETTDFDFPIPWTSHANHPTSIIWADPFQISDALSAENGNATVGRERSRNVVVPRFKLHDQQAFLLRLVDGRLELRCMVDDGWRRWRNYRPARTCHKEAHHPEHKCAHDYFRFMFHCPPHSLLETP